ncbi:MAG: O-antigen ligase family protein, partial [Candidatus Thermoplasmatota archaeon]
ALALTYSRSSYLAFLTGMGGLLALKKKMKVFSLIILLILITVIILPKGLPSEGVKLARIASIEARIGNWKQALVIAKDHLLFGVGFNTYRYTQKKYGFLKDDWQRSHAGGGADSSLLFVLATSGVLGLFGWLGLVGKILRVSRRKSFLVFSSTIAILVHCFFQNTFFYPWVLGWWMVILGTM